ncbi:MAG: tetratricopeptide repeat protein [Bacilli bacterium]|nr:tetratricopeptide repeat protein [Bacilli bacterium]
MKKYKVCVYAISKNEEKYVDKWYESMKEADEIYVLDTGSTDNTVEKLKKHNIHVKEHIITPWRFDKARCESLSMVPMDADICVCTDLDEVFNPGWRDELEKTWNTDTTRLAYNYNWLLDENNTPKVNFYIEKIHNRDDYIWIHPVHETLKYIGNKEEVKVYTDNITVNHYPDKTKSRSNYLPLLELSVKEDPEDDRNMHYLGREYMYYRKWNKAIDTLIKHLNLKSATWKDERCASMRFIARSYKALKRYDEARMWLDKAIKEAPYLRDSFVERALLEYELGKYKDVIFYCNEALKIKTHYKSYINEVFSWDHTIYDLLSVAYFYENNYKEALKCINKAIKISPNIKRLKENKKIILKEINK